MNDERARQFAALRNRYADSMPGKLELLGSLLSQAKARQWLPEDLQELKSQVHRLAGSGGGYGFPQLTELARRLEDLIKGFLQGEMTDAAAIEAAYLQLSGLMERIHRESGSC